MAARTIEQATEWDDLVRGLDGQPFQSWAWGALKERFGWQPYRLSAADGLSAVQLLVRPFRGLAAAYVPRGPLFAHAAQPAGDLLSEMTSIARSRRAAFLRLEPDVVEDDQYAGDLDELLRGRGFRPVERTLQPRSTIRLDLTPAPERLLASFSKGHRADIRRAERDGVSVRVGESAEEVDHLHQMLTATQQRKSFGIHSAAYYRVLWQAFGDSARLLLAELDGSVIAASLVLAWATHGTYLVAGSTRSGLEHRAAHLLQWHAIRWARERGARTWDMWGIGDARARLELALAGGQAPDSPQLARLEAAARRDPLDGVFRFKKGWGGRVVRLVPAYDRVFIAPAYWLWRSRRREA